MVLTEAAAIIRLVQSRSLASCPANGLTFSRRPRGETFQSANTITRGLSAATFCWAAYLDQATTPKCRHATRPLWCGQRLDCLRSSIFRRGLELAVAIRTVRRLRFQDATHANRFL